MNKPEYIITDEFKTLVEATREAMVIPNLTFMYGYIKELDETIQQLQGRPASAKTIFPLVFLEEPYTIDRSKGGFYGTIQSLRIIILHETDPTYKSYERKDKTYRPWIWPIYRELIKQIDYSLAFHTDGELSIDHLVRDQHYWSAQGTEIARPVDCRIVTLRNLMIANNPNCIVTSSF